jgi:hypothetical protein
MTFVVRALLACADPAEGDGLVITPRRFPPGLIYNIPLPGYGPRGGDIDSKGVVWVSLASGHIGSFDRRLCKGPLNGPIATGHHCNAARLVSVAKLADFEGGHVSYFDFIGITVLSRG